MHVCRAYRLGVIVEVNCETDFVARGDVFKQLASDMAMQVAACPQVTVVDISQVPSDVVEKERSVQLGKEDIIKKPENIRSVLQYPTSSSVLRKPTSSSVLQ